MLIDLKLILVPFHLVLSIMCLICTLRLDIDRLRAPLPPGTLCGGTSSREAYIQWLMKECPIVFWPLFQIILHTTFVCCLSLYSLQMPSEILQHRVYLSAYVPVLAAHAASSYVPSPIFIFLVCPMYFFSWLVFHFVIDFLTMSVIIYGICLIAFAVYLRHLQASYSWDACQAKLALSKEQQQLQTTNETLKGILSSIFDASCVCDNDGRVLECSTCLQDLLDCSPEAREVDEEIHQEFNHNLCSCAATEPEQQRLHHFFSNALSNARCQALKVECSLRSKLACATICDGTFEASLYAIVLPACPSPMGGRDTLFVGLRTAAFDEQGRASLAELSSKFTDSGDGDVRLPQSPPTDGVQHVIPTDRECASLNSAVEHQQQLMPHARDVVNQKSPQASVISYVEMQSSKMSPLGRLSGTRSSSSTRDEGRIHPVQLSRALSLSPPAPPATPVHSARTRSLDTRHLRRHHQAVEGKTSMQGSCHQQRVEFSGCLRRQRSFDKVAPIEQGMQAVGEVIRSVAATGSRNARQTSAQASMISHVEPHTGKMENFAPPDGSISSSVKQDKGKSHPLLQLHRALSLSPPPPPPTPVRSARTRSLDKRYLRRQDRANERAASGHGSYHQRPHQRAEASQRLSLKHKVAEVGPIEQSLHDVGEAIRSIASGSWNARLIFAKMMPAAGSDDLGHVKPDSVGGLNLCSPPEFEGPMSHVLPHGDIQSQQPQKEKRQTVVTSRSDHKSLHPGIDRNRCDATVERSGDNSPKSVQTSASGSETPSFGIASGSEPNAVASHRLVCSEKRAAPRTHKLSSVSEADTSSVNESAHVGSSTRTRAQGCTEKRPRTQLEKFNAMFQGFVGDRLHECIETLVSLPDAATLVRKDSKSLEFIKEKLATGCYIEAGEFQPELFWSDIGVACDSGARRGHKQAEAIRSAAENLEEHFWGELAEVDPDLQNFRKKWSPDMHAWHQRLLQGWCRDKLRQSVRELRKCTYIPSATIAAGEDASEMFNLNTISRRLEDGVYCTDGIIDAHGFWADVSLVSASCKHLEADKRSKRMHEVAKHLEIVYWKTFADFELTSARSQSKGASAKVSQDRSCREPSPCAPEGTLKGKQQDLRQLTALREQLAAARKQVQAEQELRSATLKISSCRRPAIWDMESLLNYKFGRKAPVMDPELDCVSDDNTSYSSYNASYSSYNVF